jgi:hypothetical protein
MEWIRRCECTMGLLLAGKNGLGCLINNNAEEITEE